jgi:predicted nucleic acid-binding protein
VSRYDCGLISSTVLARWSGAAWHRVSACAGAGAESLVGRTLGLADALIAAAAFADNAAVLTRNTRDFALTPVRLVTY